MKRRVVIYARVSTEHEAQISALENQVQYYDEILLRHPDWELVDRYIDEGITGTSINKRDAFLRMVKDAKSRKFDLIITREVSRFARNIVDTLQQTRILKTYGVEVWFTEDNIWTLNDEDGELRLSIMATLAQNESKKISQRVKAGQMISFKNGVLYGNGNILGYNRVGDEMVVNHEQTKTVKRIFELYLQELIDGVCDNTTFTEWKLEIQADFIFKKLVRNKQAIYDEAVAMIGEISSINNSQSMEKDKIESNIKEIDKLKGKIAVLVDLCTDGDISKEVFREKKQKLESQIEKLEQLNMEYRQKILDDEKETVVARRMESLTAFIKMKAFDENAKIPETIIDHYVDKIIYDKGTFMWILNPRLGNKVSSIKVDGSS